ncbi:MAG TPA: alpha-glucan family phosphorylase [Terriglobia bacterium]|nr:alpha-glucan family phosphorylase [Terriglobia bacterium]
MKEVKFQNIPKRLRGLETLAFDLRSTWDTGARSLFRWLSPQLWERSQYNPVRLIRDIDPNRLKRAAEDPEFLADFDAVFQRMEQSGGSRDSWFQRQYPGLSDIRIAYFSAEFGLHASLPIYSGGLGVLAGDHCKESSDLGIPLVGVGFAYPQGYFRQRIQSSGWQEDFYEEMDARYAPIESAAGPGRRLLVELKIGPKRVFVEVWQVHIGGVRVYLMDTDVGENLPADRLLTARLYSGDKEHRLRQEIVLGIGGVRVLKALGIEPAVFHANEGHTAFMLLERIREFVQGGARFTEAAAEVSATSLFTTHTPVPAGHDTFSLALMEKQFAGYWEELGLTEQQFMDLGWYGDSFNMTVLAMRLAGRRNGVSQVHGRLTRRMWKGLWPDLNEDAVPIGAITNGVHAPTWVADELGELFSRYLGSDWMRQIDNAALWDRLEEIPDDVFWATRQLLKRKLLDYINERARARWAAGDTDPRQVIAMGTLLDPAALTIGFARRFTGYKRASLIFSDLNRIRKILLNTARPVQIVFAGKAHPADEHGKLLIQQVYALAEESGMSGHVAFVENYELHAARFLTQGVDVWLNNPRPPLEASGTSGQKAGMNGVINASVPDGWWHEGYNGNNGWAIGPLSDDLEVRHDDAPEAEALYRLLEEQIVPLYYDRDDRGIPAGWVRMARESIRSTIPRFSATRMVKEYAMRMYAPAAEQLAVPQKRS